MEIEEIKPLQYSDLTPYQQSVVMNMGYMGIVANKGTPEEALKNSIEMLSREGVPEAVAVTALYSFTNTLLIQIAAQFEDPKAK